MTAKPIRIEELSGFISRWRIEFDTYLALGREDNMTIDACYDTSRHPVRVWIRENLSEKAVIYPMVGVVWCDSEEDAMLLYMAFR